MAALPGTVPGHALPARGRFAEVFETYLQETTMALKEVFVPDIGDFKDVPIIEMLVKAGDTVKAE